MKRWITAVGALAMMNGGCDPIVFGPVEPQPTEEPPPPPSPNALAMRAGDWALSFEGRVTSSLDYAQHLLYPPPHPESLVLFLSDSVQECSRPLIHDPTQCVPASSQFWQVILVIPPELNRPGLIDLRDHRIRIYHGVLRPDCGGSFGFSPGSWGAPGKWEKTIEIVSSDASSVSVKLDWGELDRRELASGELPDVWGHIDGDYNATYCGAAPPVSPASPGLALRGARGPTMPIDGLTPDPDALQLILGSAATSCEDPLSPINCTGTSRVRLSLPPSLQQPGIIDLTDPAIDASFAVSWGSAEFCDDYDFVTGSFAGGTVEILGIDASGVLARVYGSYTDLTHGGFDADGLYAASICP
ncbi:hypothetical protein WME76_24010 [Sorangium sp. So ce119]|uniref:hypothetical protein n=1 Tax=Sorangium sp. So ce119 TaxID=3133279 RepID=UPI003F5FF814